MSRGIYRVAHERLKEQTIALLNSIGLSEYQRAIGMIPFDENYHEIAEIVTTKYGVQIYENLEFADQLCQKLCQIFGAGFFNNPNKQRKQACWFAPFDEFLYIDTDIVVFDKIAKLLDYLKDSDFFCYDYQHTNGIENVFNPKVLEEGMFTPEDLKNVFNSGLWGSKKGLFTENELYETFAECAAHTDYFDFSQKTTDQPIFNYLVLKRIQRRFNIVRREGKAPGSWAGSRHFQREGDRLIDSNLGQPLDYLHWAGFRIEPGCPYWDILEHSLYLNEPKPDRPLTKPTNKSLAQRGIEQVKKIVRKIKDRNFISHDSITSKKFSIS